jgi:hypothetical protein
VGEGRGEEGKRLFFLVVVGFVSHGDGRQFSQTTTTIRVGECSRDRIKTNLARRKQTRNFPKTRWRGNETHSPGRFRNVESGAHHIQPYFTVREPSLLFGTLGRGQSASNPAPLVHNHMQNMQCYGQTAPRSITFRRPLVNRRWGPKAVLWWLCRAWLFQTQDLSYRDIFDAPVDRSRSAYKLFVEMDSAYQARRMSTATSKTSTNPARLQTRRSKS